MSLACRYRCAVVGCTGEEGDQKSFHYLPADPEQRKAWLKLIGLPPCVPKHSKIVICGRHFTRDDYARRPDVMLGLAVQCRNLLLKNVLPTLFLPVCLSQYSQVQEVTAALASDGSDYELPNSSKCHCKCHPETSTKAVQTHTMVAWTHCVTSTQTYVTKVPNMCRCSCHCMMSTAAVQTTPFVRRTSCSQTNESFISATMTRMDAGLQACLDATICVTVGLQTDPKPPVVALVVKRSRGRPVKSSRGRPVKSSRKRVVRKK
ncbi:hypothetical protein MRX96_038995 [Rhipicephalus microplus]